MRRCLVCGIPDEPEHPMRLVHARGEKGRAEQGYTPHRYDPGERRIRDQGRQARRTWYPPRTGPRIQGAPRR